MNRSRFFAYGLAGTVLFSAGLALAESVDMQQMTCGQALGLDEDTAAVVMVWVDGYLSGVTGDTTVDLDRLEYIASELHEACSRSPKTRLLDAARIVGIE